MHIRILAEAERRRTEIEAEGRARGLRVQAESEAAAIRARAEAEADAIRARGLAEADALKAKGLAEAESLQRRVAVLNEQNQAAILDKALSDLPEIAGKLFEAYGKIGNVTYVGSGDGDGLTSRVSREVVGMVPMMGAMFEATTGLKLRDLITGMESGNGHQPLVEGMAVEKTKEPAVIVPVAETSVQSPNGTGEPPAPQ